LVLVHLLADCILVDGSDECHSFFSEVAPVGDLPFVVLFGEDGSDEVDD